MFVLVSKSANGIWAEYYSGKTYVHQGERWASLGNKTEAKIYKSRKRAELAAEALGNKVGYTFIAEELKD